MILRIGGYYIFFIALFYCSVPLSCSSKMSLSKTVQFQVELHTKFVS